MRVESGDGHARIQIQSSAFRAFSWLDFLLGEAGGELCGSLRRHYPDQVLWVGSTPASPSQPLPTPADWSAPRDGWKLGLAAAQVKRASGREAKVAAGICRCLSSDTALHAPTFCRGTHDRIEQFQRCQCGRRRGAAGSSLAARTGNPVADERAGTLSAVAGRLDERLGSDPNAPSAAASSRQRASRFHPALGREWPRRRPRPPQRQARE